MFADRRHLHTPSTSWPIVGVLPELLRKRRDLHNLFLRYATESRAAQKPFVSLSYSPFHRMVLVADPLIADEVMRSPHFANRTSFPIIDAIYAQFVGSSGISTNMGGITFVNAEPWRRNRVAAQRCLSRPGFLAQTRSVTRACTDRLIDSWRALGLIDSGAPVDLGREMSRLAIDVMGHLCWQTDLGAIAGDHNRFFEPVHTMLDAIQRYIYVPLPASVLMRLPLPTLRRLRAAVKQLRGMGDSLMSPRLDANGTLRNEDDSDDMLAFLLKELVADPAAPSRDDLDNVQATLMDLLGAGHDTTANALAFCLGLLAQPQNAHWQDRAMREARMLDGESTEERSSGVLAAAYRETLRLYPLGAMFSRVASADTTLSTSDGEVISISAGTQLFISPYVMGRDVLEWRAVTRFQPERHLAETGDDECPHLAKRRLPAYAPYGGGKRSCVGAQFAEVEAQAALCRILSRLRITLLQGDVEIEADLLFTMRPRRPLYARIDTRT